MLHLHMALLRQARQEAVTVNFCNQSHKHLQTGPDAKIQQSRSARGSDGLNELSIIESDSGGQRAAALYSLIATAKLNGLDPALRTVQVQVPEHPIIESRNSCPGYCRITQVRLFQSRLATLNRCPPKNSGHFQ
jgi:hypothetical protein